MKILNKQVVEFMVDAREINKKSLPFKLGYAIAKNLEILKPIGVAYDQEHNKIIDTYAVKDEEGKVALNGTSCTISDVEQYNAALDELLEIENEVELHKVSFDELEKCDLDKFDALSVRDIMALEIMTK